MKPAWILPAALAVMSGCASDRAFREGRDMLAAGRLEEGFGRLEQAVQEAPGNAEYRSYLYVQRERALNQLLVQGQAARTDGRFDEAAALYGRALAIAPGSPRVEAALESLRNERKHARQLAEAGTLVQQGQVVKAQALLRAILAEDPRHRGATALLRQTEERRGRDVTVSPQLRSLLSKPITLEFRDFPLKSVFEVMSRSAGISFTFDRDVRTEQPTSIFVQNASIEDALQLLLRSNQLERRVVNDNTLLIYPNTPIKQREYQELVIKSFYLANSDVKQVAGLIRSMLKTRDVFVDERINQLVIRDTPEAVRAAEKLVATNDLAEPEAVLDVEVLEVSRGRLQSLGLKWPEQIGYGLVQGPQETTVLVNGVPQSITTTAGGSLAQGVVDLHNRQGLTAYAANPLLLLNLHAQDTQANVLANPRIRVKNREKAKVHVGDRVPVLTSTATATGFVSQSVSYLDVGVKLDVEPSIGLENEVSIKIGLEVSNIVRQITNSSGTTAYQVGARAAGTTLRLRDGETQILAGLIQEEDRRTASKVPGLGDLPVLGRLFSSNEDNGAKTEIVLLITPHIVRNLVIPPAEATEFAAGTEIGIGRSFGAVAEAAPPLPAPAEAAPAADVPAAESDR